MYTKYLNEISDIPHLYIIIVIYYVIFLSLNLASLLLQIDLVNVQYKMTKNAGSYFALVCYSASTL